MSRFPFGAILLALALNLGAAPVPKAQPKDSLYFPIKKGTKWVYDDDGEEITKIVTDVKQKDEKKRVWVVTVSRSNKEGKVALQEEWEVSDEGLLMALIITDGDGKPLPTKAECVLKLPHKPGAKWEVVPKNDAIQGLALEPRRVKVPAGEFEAVGVEASLGKAVLATEWYAPGVGLVKRDMGKTRTVLKSFTPGKD